MPNIFLKYENYVYKIMQIVLGVLFVVSGFVKGIDPVGVSYKVTEYLELFGLGFFDDFALWISVGLCAVEIFIGLMLLVGVYKKLIALVALLFMFGFTAITFYLVIDPSSAIQECGCFGDAFKLTNTETFLKNIFFVTLSALYFWRQVKYNDCPRVSSSSSNRSIFLSSYLVIIALMIPTYSILFLPPFDFLPFNRGENILENIHKESIESTDKITFIYKHKASGKSHEFNIDDTTWRDNSQWEYVDTKIPETRQETNYLSKFVVMDAKGSDFAATVFDDSDYNFIVIARNVDNLRDVDFERIAPLYELHKDGKINLFLFTSSDLGKANEILSLHGFSAINGYNVDEVVLKSMIRNEQGVMLVSGGAISGKWNLKHDSFKSLDDTMLPALVAHERNIILKYAVLLFLLVTVLFLSVKLTRLLTKRKDGEVKSDICDTGIT